MWVNVGEAVERTSTNRSTGSMYQQINSMLKQQQEEGRTLPRLFRPIDE